MLKLIRCMRDVDFAELLNIYRVSDEIYGCYECDEEGRFSAEHEFYQYLKDVFFQMPDALYAVWSVQRSAVSALRVEAYCDGLLVTALETAPESRRKGYATLLLSAILSEFGSQKIYSHVHRNNAASMRVHEKCGFVRISDSATMIDGSFMPSYCTLCYDNNGKAGQ